MMSNGCDCGATDCVRCFPCGENEEETSRVCEICEIWFDLEDENDDSLICPDCEGE